MPFEKLEHEAIAFINMFYNAYLVERNFDKVISFLHQDISWYGTGAHEICKNYSDAIKLLTEEKALWDGHFTIKEISNRSLALDESKVIVSSEMQLVEDAKNSLLLEAHSRASTICVKENNRWQVIHIHFSVPNAAQSENEFIHNNIVEDYNKKLAEQLNKRTKVLKQKTRELEILTDNISGGVMITSDDSLFNIKYISNGFEALSGYSIKTLMGIGKTSYLELLYAQDKQGFIDKITKQINESGSFSMEYRIVHKDGHNIWILDNGICTKTTKGKKILQSVLTDITFYKEQQEALRLSEMRYALAMRLSEIVMFEYDIQTRQLFLFDRDAETYNVPNIVEDGVETFIARGIVGSEYAVVYREMYRKIHAGAPYASCYIHARDAMGLIHEHELILHTVYDLDGLPVRAVGVRKNVSQIRRLEKDSEYGKSLVAGKVFICEADITNNKILYLHDIWANAIESAQDITYDDAFGKISKYFAAPEHQSFVAHRLSREYIKEKFSSGECLVVFNYKRKTDFGAHFWFEATVNIIRDERNGNIFMRLYHRDINEMKIKEQRVASEQRLYETVLSKATLSYEVNITQDRAINGHENWYEHYGIESTENYSQMIIAFSQRGIYAEDKDDFANKYNRSYVLQHFANGERQIMCQYRRPNEDGVLRWVQCILHLYEDPDTHDVKGFSCVEDIDEQKRNELELIFNAEHDTMTGLLNKTITEKVIDEFLEYETHDKCHALLMLDIDYFKNINDSFGHSFGDEVLCDVSARLRKLFNPADVLGRIGGDEFIVFLKNISSQNDATVKAQEICNILRREYRENGVDCNISASVGIAMFPCNGINYAELYAHADCALYKAKNNGKNTFST